MMPQRLALPDHDVTYVDRAGAGTPLVLLHGGAVDRRMWAPQLDGLTGRRLLAPDARGHGGTSDATAPYRLCDDVVALLDALEVPRAVLVGVSMGGGTAVDAALEHPDRVAGLVVSGTATSEPRFAEPWALEVFAAWARAEQEADVDAWIEAFLRFVAGPDRSRADVDPAVWSAVETMGRETLRDHVRVGPDGAPVPPVRPTPVTRTWERLPEVAVPVLALVGGADGEDHRTMGEQLAALVPDGRLVVVPGAAHYPNLERPQEFDAAVLGFLAASGL
jgi:3-oxoadipate enol-lactonase